MREPLPKRILMTGDTVGGVWTFTLELAGALAAPGVEVVLATMGGEASEAQRAEADRVPGLRLCTSRFKLEWMEDPWDDVAASGRWLLSLEEQYEPDLVHLNSYGHGALPWRSPVVASAHSCVLSWWEAVRREPLPQRWNEYQVLVTRSLASAAVITAPSQAMLRAVETHYGPELPQSRIVVPNGRSSALFRPAAKEPFVLTAGRLWDEAKNATAVARIAARLPWPVYLAGDNQGARFEPCRILGRLSASELAGWYSRASIYALPARYEPFGLSALEAALAGCALVLGDIPSLREVWQDAAVYVPSDDADSLDIAIRALIADPVRREAMAQRAAFRARAFTPERMARGYLDAYRAALHRQEASCAS
jgi:glycogen synthase